MFMKLENKYMENSLFFDLLKKIKHLFTPYYINFSFVCENKKI